jgi:predicted PurR-regulated permease PerM
MFFSLKNKHAVEISPSIVIFTVGFLGTLYFLFVIRQILVLLFLAFIVMTALRPTVEKLNRKLGIPRMLAIVLVYVLTLAGLTGLIVLVLPPFVNEINNFLRTIDFPVLQDEIKNIKFTLSEWSGLLDQVGNGAGFILSLIEATFNIFFAFFTVMVMSVYLMIDRPALHKKIGWLTKNRSHLKKAAQFLDSIEAQLGGWIRGQIILMVLIGVITYIGLSLLSMPYALPLAILAGLLEILPNLGPTLAAVPAVVIGFMMVSPLMGIAMLVFYTLVQQLENNLIVPKVMQANADVNPLIAILTILAGLKMGGVIGALLAVPFYILLRSVYRLYLEFKQG